MNNTILNAKAISLETDRNVKQFAMVSFGVQYIMAEHKCVHIRWYPSSCYKQTATLQFCNESDESKSPTFE